MAVAVVGIAGSIFFYIQSNELRSEMESTQQELAAVLTLAGKYLEAEGRKIIPGENVSCSEKPKQCLEYWTQNLTQKIGPECSSVQDGICPGWCAAGADYDCCNQKEGYNWVQGRGCYGG